MSQEPTASTTEIPEKPKSNILDLLIAALLEKYSPAGPTENVEMKSTLDILDEMEPVAQLDRWQLQIALEQSGFKPTYTDAGAFWLLYKI